MNGFRKSLTDSYIAAIAVAVLLLWSIDLLVRALWQPVFGALEFLFTAVSILGIPYFDRKLDTADRLMLFNSGYYLFYAIVSLVAAWLLSRWAYGAGPIRGLSESWGRLERKHHD